MCQTGLCVFVTLLITVLTNHTNILIKRLTFVKCLIIMCLFLVERGPMVYFILRLKTHHDTKGLTPAQVHTQTGIAVNTIKRYTERDFVLLKALSPSIVILCRFYGVEWKDVVELADDEGITKTPLLATG